MDRLVGTPGGGGDTRDEPRGDNATACLISVAVRPLDASDSCEPNGAG